jgi:hypothetical protein
VYDVNDRRVSVAQLGAWLLKCNADTGDTVARAERAGRVDRLCVQSNYRTALMSAGQRVIFWVSGSRRGGRVPGIWGVGWIAGPADGDSGAFQVPLAVTVLAEPERVDRDVLRADDRLRDLEVLRMPQGSNPSYVSADALRVIEEYVTWPPPAPR